MSRPLLILALAVLALAGLAPIAAMAARVDAADLASLLDERTLSLLGRTLYLGLGVAAVAVLLGAPFGWLTSRTDLPLARVLRPLGVVPLLLPPLVLAMTWVALVDLRGAIATVLVLGIGTFPFVALFTAKAAERIDRSREEAALLCGGTRAVLAMQRRLLAPAVACGACLAFVFAVNDFAVPDYVSSVGPKFNVYADEVFASWRVHSEAGRAVVTSLPLVALTLVSLLPALALRRRGALATFDTGFRAPRPLALGGWRWPLLALCLAVVVVGTLLPVGRLVLEAGGGVRVASAQAPGAAAGAPDLVAAGTWSLGHLQGAFRMALERAREPLANSLVYSACAATVCVPAGFVLGHAIARARRGKLLELLCVLPLAVPAILFGMGYIALWSRPGLADVYESGALVVLLFVGRFLVFCVLVASGAVSALGRDQEEAARLAGAPPAARLGRIVAPAVWPSLAGGWVLVFVLSMRELDAAILVPATNDTVMFKIYNAVHFGRDDYVAALALLVVFFIVLPGLSWSLLGRRRLEVLP